MDRRQPDYFLSEPPGEDRVKSGEKALAKAFGGRWQAWLSGENRKPQVMFVQTEEIEGRRTITGVVVLGETLSATDLRNVSLGSIETALNLTADAPADTGADDDLDDLPPLTRDPKIRPADWSALVARHYKAWARRSPNPAAEMSKRWGVNRQTVNAWIREARLRGLLPPARRTKGG